MSLTEIQSELATWQDKNFPFWKEWEVVLGVQEEAGELAHHFLKRHQRIRGSRLEHTEKMRDAVGDIVIFLMGVCSREGWDLEEVVGDTWAKVKRRDWTGDRE